MGHQGKYMVSGMVASTSALLAYYSFETQGGTLNQIVDTWLSRYPAKWVVAAIVEALYQGRYKTSSVDRILRLWRFRGQPLHHFDYEFVEIVCSGLFNSIAIHPATLESSVKRLSTVRKSKQKLVHVAFVERKALDAA